MESLLNKYSQAELKQIIQKSFSYKDLAENLGYTAFSGDLKNFLQNKIQNFDISHFYQKKDQKRIKRTQENVFCKNSTADQKTLKDWYRKGQYTNYRCSICNLEPYWQNKPLTLILDHINGENHDNRLQNLRWVCPNCNQQLDTTNGKNKKILKKKYYCQICGQEVTKEGCLCRECSLKKRTIPLQQMPTTREELKQLIRTETFVQIGKIFNVSDNTIRKWCDKFNLPRKKTDINKISDQEWLKI